jgi:GTP-binding protein Era
MVEIPSTRAGYVALLGRPNVGKSTLLNCLLDQKISITSPKPQTTRHTILGVKTLPTVQIVYVDTPGLHSHARRAMNRYMNRAASNVLGYVDAVVVMVEALRWTDEDEAAVGRLAAFTGPVILAVNKVDRVAEKSSILPFLARVSSKREFAEIVPISALRRDNLDTLESLVARLMPESEFFFSPDQITTASLRFRAAELLREKLTLHLRDEIPYALTVEIENFVEDGGLLRIGAVILVERSSQKGIIIGKRGRMLKEIGREAREDMERVFNRKVFLETWVTVKEGWSDDERALRGLGYQEQS